jgi:hypothetical protein
LRVTREERQKQLEEMLRSSRDKLVDIYREKVSGRGTVGPVGISSSQLIPKILDAEFPERDKK